MEVPRKISVAVSGRAAATQRYHAKMEQERVVSSQKTKKRAFTWMSKQKMIDTFGAAKAQAKIEFGKLDTQPDPDTKLDDEWNIEYKIWAEKETETETSIDCAR